jgi:uncharacterized protein (DUF433 family)
MSPSMEDQAAFTSEQVIRITGISRRRLDYWLEHGIVTADVQTLRGNRRLRLWSFRNLIEVRVALWLREKVSLQLMGKVVQKLRKDGFLTPLADVRVAVTESSGGATRVFIQRDDGNWEVGHSGQVVLQLALPLTRFRDEMTRAVQRDKRQRRRPGQIVRRRGRLGSAPVFAGTRVPVAAVGRMLKAGWDAQRILREFPGLTEADVEAAATKAG